MNLVFTEGAALLAAAAVGIAAVVRWVRIGREAAGGEGRTLRKLQRERCLWQLLFAAMAILAVLK